MKNIKKVLIGFIVGLSAMGAFGLASGIINVKAKTVSAGSLIKSYKPSKIKMKVYLGRQDNRFSKNRVMLPFSVKLTNPTKNNVRFYFTQVYNYTSMLGGETRYNKKVQAPHRNVLIKAHHTVTVKKAFYLNDQAILSWTQPNSYGNVHYGKNPDKGWLMTVSNNSAGMSKGAKRANSRLFNHQHYYYYN